MDVLAHRNKALNLLGTSFVHRCRYVRICNYIRTAVRCSQDIILPHSATVFIADAAKDSNNG